MQVKANKGVAVRVGSAVYLHVKHLYYTNPVAWNFLCHVEDRKEISSVLHPLYAVDLALSSI